MKYRLRLDHVYLEEWTKTNGLRSSGEYANESNKDQFMDRMHAKRVRMKSNASTNSQSSHRVFLQNTHKQQVQRASRSCNLAAENESLKSICIYFSWVVPTRSEGSLININKFQDRRFCLFVCSDVKIESKSKCRVSSVEGRRRKKSPTGNRYEPVPSGMAPAAVSILN